MKRLIRLLVVAFVAVALAIPATASADDRAVTGIPDLLCDGITYDSANPNHVLVPDPNGFQGFINAGVTAIVKLSGPNQVLFVNYIGASAPGAALYPAWDGSVNATGTVFADTMCLGPSDPTTFQTDMAFGLGGDDRIFLEGGDAFANGGGGDDFIDAGSWRIPSQPDFDGSGGPNAGDDGPTVIIGGRGNDVLVGNDMADTLRGGPDDDVLTGDLGFDRLLGGPGDDVLEALGAGNDPTAAACDDAGGQFLHGGTGNDVVTAGDCGDLLIGAAGDDTLNGGVLPDVIKGNAGNDTAMGGAGIDNIKGGSGDDYIDGGSGADAKLFGGTGNDQIFAGAEVLGVADADVNLKGGTGADILAANGDSGVGGAGCGDTLDGEAGDDLLYGGPCDDTLILGDGADQAWGWTGNDTFTDKGDGQGDNMWGEKGNDTYNGGEETDLGVAAFNDGSCDPLAPSQAVEAIGEGADDFNNMFYYTIYETGTDPALAPGDVCGA